MLSLVDAWIKAAVEHQTLQITYLDSKGDITVRDVEPDFYGHSRNGRNFGLWGICLLRGNVRCFKEENVSGWRHVGNKFTPNPLGRWMEMLPVYNQKKLKQQHF